KTVAEAVLPGLAWRKPWLEWIHVRMKKSQDGKDCRGNRCQQQKDHSQVSDQPDSQHIQPRHQNQKQKSNQPMLCCCQRTDSRNVVRHGYTVGSTHQERSRPVPPSALEAPEIAKGGACPAIKPSFHRHSRSHLGRGERNWNTKEERNSQKKNKRHSRTRSGDNGLEPKGSPGTIGV